MSTIKLHLMCRFLLVVLLFISGLSSTLAQEEYRVIVAHGRTYLQTTSGFHQIEQGEWIAERARIELVDNSWLAMMDRQGSFFVIDKSGVYDLKNVNLIQTGDSSRAAYQLWTDFLEMQENHTDPEPEMYDLQIPLPSSSEVFGHEILLSWNNIEVEKYRVDVLDEFEQAIEVFETSEAFLKLDLLSSKLAWKRQVFIRVRGDGSGVQSPLYALAKLPPPEFDFAKNDIEKLPRGESVLSVLTKAIFFEIKGWYADVSTLLYRHSENAVLAQFYLEFLKRNGFLIPKHLTHR